MSKELDKHPERIRLAEHVPLSMPLALYYFPTTFCNFRCAYCLHGQSEEALKKISFRRQNLDFAVYRKSIDSLLEFPDKLKSILFIGMGEPLIHKKIGEMIAYATEKNVAEKTEIVTNGALLSKEMSHTLIDAGLGRLRVSVQGVSAARYRETAGVDINFATYVEQLKYFYENRKNTYVYIKIIDSALADRTEEAEFFKIFGSICDEIAVEPLMPYFDTTIDYSRFGGDMGRTKEGQKIREVRVCPIPFYTMTVMPDGNVCMCQSYNNPFRIGNVQDSPLPDLWNSKEAAEFRIRQLKGERCSNLVCRECTLPVYLTKREDLLDEDAQNILNKLNTGGT